MATTVANLMAEVRSFFQAPSDSEVNTVVLAGLNSAVRKINTRAWQKLYAIKDHTLVAGTDEYSNEATFRLPIRMLLLDSSSNQKGILKYMTEDEFYSVYYSVSGTNGSPVAYTVNYSTSKVKLSCKPSASFVSSYPTLRHYYHTRAAALTAGGSTAFNSEFDEFLVARAALYLARVKDQSAVPHWLHEEAELWRALKADDTNMMTDYM